MARVMTILGLSLTLILFLLAAPPLGAERLQFATSVEWSPPYFLPPLAAEEQAIWKRQGLEASWTPFRGSAVMFKALAGGSIATGFADASAAIQAATGGVAALVVADTRAGQPFSLYVRGDSPLRKGEDLRGKVIGLGRFGGGHHAYVRLMVKEMGLTKEVKMVALGGMQERLAALKTGKVDAIVTTFDSVANLKVKGELKEVANAADYLPKEWAYLVMVASREFALKEPDTVRRAVRGIVEAMNFIMNNHPWAVEKMKVHGLTEPAAREIMKGITYGRDGKIDPKRLENVRTFLIDYGILPKEKVPPLEQLYTNRFAQ